MKQAPVATKEKVFEPRLFKININKSKVLDLAKNYRILGRAFSGMMKKELENGVGW